MVIHLLWDIYAPLIKLAENIERKKGEFQRSALDHKKVQHEREGLRKPVNFALLFIIT